MLQQKINVSLRNKNDSCLNFTECYYYQIFFYLFVSIQINSMNPLTADLMCAGVKIKKSSH